MTEPQLDAQVQEIAQIVTDQAIDIESLSTRVARIDAMMMLSPPARPRAIDYAHLVGKYIRMERAATPEEYDALDEETVGMECFVAMVTDGEEGVEIYGDTHEVHVVRPGDVHMWRWHVWESETARRNWKYHE